MEKLEKTAVKKGIKGVSVMLRKYRLRLAFRVLTAAATVWVLLADRTAFQVLTGWGFWQKLSPLHLLWVIWMVDMVLQLIPVREVMALGSQKQFGRWYRPAAGWREEELAAYVRRSDRGANKVLVSWVAMTIALGVLRSTEVFGPEELFLSAVFFYVCDLICVVVWCPFRTFLMKNRCCTTCRIFNWDHLMMFVPFLFVPGFYGWTLLGMAVVVVVVWEVLWHRHPERFWEGSNQALRCANCTDRLCGR
ncbi:hypothetical protein [Intestinimonas sp. HCP28S3_D6]|uniref:hypothetical protein n=1 Tax=Intestinimonas sp. HCP28S3_D6 TaxID=3438942 RepID=UPI003F88A03A